MVSLNRQSHIVTRYGKSRNITLHGLLSIEPSASRRESTLFTVDPAARDNIESELEAGTPSSREHLKEAPRFVDLKGASPEA